jgi:two-component system, chemotaxis family, protein-glutamate methylesterase/glutaminase
MAKKIKTLIVDDSIIVRHVLSDILASDPSIELIAAAEDPIAAMEIMRTQRPDVIILDIEMPRMDGITFLRKIMSEDPIPVVMCSSLTEKGAKVTVDALALGALDIITKPKANLKGFLYETRTPLLEAIKAAANANLKNLQRSAALSGSLEPHPALESTSKNRIITLGASTGGVQALELVLAQLPLDVPGIVIVQHMSSEFTPAFAEYLNRVCQIEVREARHQEQVRSGLALLAPGSRHMQVSRQSDEYWVEIKDGPVIKRHRPSIDVLFRSVARTAGRNAIGVLLTGMGDDGVAGMHEIQKVGGYTIAQDESTCVVYGIPAAAVKQQAVHEVLPVEKIAEGILAQITA